ncbi:replication initiation protein [Bacillus solitudinis]|uniref:replication initiation protein n=1 Tax=Bacillus solitudinis TaxID=2014074 RepID=UPI000C23EFDF|nr:replication initiation protein [Bacillus solitudinis]
MKELKSTDYNLVTKSNMLIEANYKLGTVEQKIILFLASQIQPQDSEFKNYKFTIREFSKLIGLKGTPKYNEIKKITIELMRKVFTVRIGNEVTQVSWLSSVTYKENEGMMFLRFDPFLKPYLLELKRNFTSYRLENVVKLKSSYSIRLYELLKQYERIKERTFSLDELRLLLGADDIYPSYGNFKQRVLNTAQKELEKKTDLSFDVEEIKSGRRVTSVRFIIKTKKKSIVVESIPLFAEEDYFSAQIQLFANEHNVSIDQKVIESWRNYEEDRVLDILNKIRGRRDIESPVAYITHVLNKLKEETAVEADTDDVLISKAIRNLYKEYAGRRDPVVGWLVEGKLVDSLIKEFGLSQEAANNYWKEHGNQIVRDLKAKVKANKDKRR